MFLKPKKTGVFLWFVPMSKNEDVIVVEGIVKEILPASQCRVEIGGTDGMPKKMIIAYLSGKMKKNFIRIIPGGKVKVELSMYDLTKGRIVFREINSFK